MLEREEHRKQLFHTFFFACFFATVLWIIKFTEIVFQCDLAEWGVYPRQIKGIAGILFAPLIHSDFNHLFSNTIPILILTSGLFYFYRSIAYPVFFWIYLMSGIWVWVSARPAFHIGASGVVYGLVAFLFFSGIIRRHSRLVAFSMLVVFIYGSLIWGIFPIDIRVSWEYHLLGSIAGVFCAFYFKKIGLQKEKFEWENVAEDESQNNINEDVEP